MEGREGGEKWRFGYVESDRKAPICKKRVRCGEDGGREGWNVPKEAMRWRSSSDSSLSSFEAGEMLRHCLCWGYIPLGGGFRGLRGCWVVYLFVGSVYCVLLLLGAQPSYRFVGE